MQGRLCRFRRVTLTQRPPRLTPRSTWSNRKVTVAPSESVKASVAPLGRWKSPGTTRRRLSTGFVRSSVVNDWSAPVVVPSALVATSRKWYVTPWRRPVSGSENASGPLLEPTIRTGVAEP